MLQNLPYCNYFGNVETDPGDLSGEKQINLTVVFGFSYFINLANFEAFSGTFHEA